ncbi:MAG: hypothetical protein U0528_17100 [Anaerolineae bacterium]
MIVAVGTEAALTLATAHPRIVGRRSAHRAKLARSASAPLATSPPAAK